jgi:hypothetical protein
MLSTFYFIWIELAHPGASRAFLAAEPFLSMTIIHPDSP